MSDIKRDRAHSNDPNPDPITGEPGSHPIGTGLGAAAGGAVTGLAAGAVAGPIGAAVGAAVGAVAGGLAGKEVTEYFDPTAEDAYWRDQYASRPYYDPALSYDDYRPAYEHGWASRTRYPESSFEKAEDSLKRDWESTKHHADLTWERAKLASRDAWDHVDDAVHGRHHTVKS